MSLSQEFEHEGTVETCDRPRSSRPRTATCDANIDRVRQLLGTLENPRAEDIAIELGISQASVLEILHDLDYHFVLSSWVPYRLTVQQRQQRVQTARNNIRWLDRNPRNLDRLIDIDETWIYSYMPEYG